jgi:isopenicillin N synthase-like dioxygenase
MSNFKSDREAMDRAAAKLLEAQRKAGNSQVTHEQVKQRIIEAVERKR